MTSKVLIKNRLPDFF